MSSFLTNDDYLIVSRLLSFFSSSYGPRGRLKLIQTLDNSMSICTSISSRIQRQLKCRHLISRLLSAAIQKQTSVYHDGGLYFSILFCSALLQCRDMSSDSTMKLRLFEGCLDLLDQMKTPTETITFDSIHPLMAIVRAILCKPLIDNQSDSVREHLSLLSVKAFLEKMASSSSSQQQLTVTVEGIHAEESALSNGLLYQTSVLHPSLCSKATRACLYFTISLAGEYTIDDVDHIETDKQMFEWIQKTADRLAQQISAYTELHHGGLVLCQKVIHPTVKVKLRRYGIETIDRLSRQYTPYFCYLTGCQPIETLSLKGLDERYFGSLTEIQSITIGHKSFLQFFNANRPFHTLLLCSHTEQALLELKECMQTSHSILTNVLQSKQVLYGGGCSESMQLFFLQTRRNHLAGRFLSHILQRVLRAHSDQDYVVDRIHGHLWYLSDNDQISKTCACELYKATDRFQIEWKSLTFHLDNDPTEEVKLDDGSALFVRQTCARYLDSCHMRSHALRTALETAMNLQVTSICL